MKKTNLAPRMLRASITPDEWATIRVLAIHRKTSTADLVADALRATLLKNDSA